jgi:phosphatidylglycerophosphatase A
VSDAGASGIHRLGVWLATCAGVGYAPVAPGTAGSAVGVAVAIAVQASGSAWVEAGVILGLLGAGIWGCGVAERHFGRTDPGHAVIDEVVGMLVTVAFLPVGAGGLLAGFLLFRVFDIVKPWPARRLERLHGGLGIMADDVMAGLYAHVALRGLLAFAPAWLA